MTALLIDQTLSGMGLSRDWTIDYDKIISIMPALTFLMEQYGSLKNVNNCLNTNIRSYLETSGGQNSNLYLNVVHLFNTSVN